MAGNAGGVNSVQFPDTGIILASSTPPGLYTIKAPCECSYAHPRPPNRRLAFLPMERRFPITLSSPQGKVECATCVIASSPGLGIAHFAGSTQTVTSSAVDVSSADVTGTLAAARFPALTGDVTQHGRHAGNYGRQGKRHPTVHARHNHSDHERTVFSDLYQYHRHVVGDCGKQELCSELLYSSFPCCVGNDSILHWRAGGLRLLSRWKVDGPIGAAGVWGQAAASNQTTYGTKTAASSSTAATGVDHFSAQIQNGSTASSPNLDAADRRERNEQHSGAH